MNKKNKNNKIAKIKDAASLVIYRGHGKKHEVLMGRRGNKARFKPGVYVFPGGVVERADYRAVPKTDLNPTFKRHMAVSDSRNKANTLAMTAVREAYEEVGLIFGSNGHIGKVEQPSWTKFRELNLSPNLSKLDYLGRAITPSIQPIRFHARFFAIPYELLRGSIGGDGELEDVRWIRIDKYGDFDMMRVQHMILDILEEKLENGRAAPQKLFFKWNRINVVTTP